MDRDDDLAQTATSADSAKRVPSETLETGAQLGRYTIQRMLGAGGMGVVYAAFDPELERRVALKILRPGLAAEAEHRLLREARSMARLTSPNVVAVYDVGTADGRDYIAMELIDGENVDEWYDRAHPDRDTVLATFLAAGRGLAAAHEAGVVHRDFKPHNILRSTRGDKIVVTDFGLARDSGTVADAPRTTPMPMVLTAPGSFLGTPAYMAPEQWTGGEVTQATDQFAFCIALWEGLTGKRPFHGATVDELRACVLRGLQPGAVDQLPRRVRAAIGRGLSVDPDRRWPSMHALLARLEHRRRRIAAVVAGAIAITAIVVLATRGSVLVATCEPPAIAPNAVWGLAQQLQIRAGSAAVATTLDTTFAHWQAARAAVCTETGATRAARLDCLDRVLLRFDAIRRGRLGDLRASQWGVIAQLYEPEVCTLPDPPRMPSHYSEAAILGLAQRAGVKLDDATIMRAKQDPDPCAQSYFAFTDPDGVELARSAAQLCGDDQAYGAATLNTLRQRTNLSVRDEATAMREAERAVKHAAQPFLLRQYYLFRAERARARDDLDGALGFIDRAAGGEPVEFEVRRRIVRASMLLARASGEDLEAAQREAEAIKALWPPAMGSAVALDVLAATARWWQGDVAGADPILVAENTRIVAASADVARSEPPVRGVVVDDRGTPVAGAAVSVGAPGLRGDATTTAIALFSIDDWPRWIQTVQTDAEGRFVFAHAPRPAVVVAQAGTRRSLAAPSAATLRLVLAPTTSIRGHVHGELDRGQRFVTAPQAGGNYDLIAPIRADGSFELAGAPLGTIELQTIQLEGSHFTTGARRRLDTTRSREVELDAPNPRTLDVIVRSATLTPIQRADVTILEGKQVVATAGALQTRSGTTQFTSESARPPAIDEVAPALAKMLQSGDLLARARGVSAGTITVCAQGNLESSDPEVRERYAATAATQPVGCEIVDAAATLVVVVVPPMKRVD